MEITKLNTGSTTDKIISKEIINVSCTGAVKTGYTASAKASSLEVCPTYKGRAKTIAHLIKSGKTALEALTNLSNSLDEGFTKEAIKESKFDAAKIKKMLNIS